MNLAPFAAMLALAAATALAAEPVFSENFQSAAADQAPEGMMVVAGDFLVKEEAGNRFLELPGEPLDTSGALFGPAAKGDQTLSARIFGTRSGRRFPAFGISLGGAGGYRLVLSAGKKALEIFKGDEAKTSVPIEWTAGSWTALRLQLRKTAGGAVVEGKAWAAEGSEPAGWQIKFETSDPPPQGRAGIWGSPYSGTPIRFDDLHITPAS